MKFALYTFAGIAAVATALPQEQPTKPRCLGPQTFDAAMVPQFGNVGIKARPGVPGDCITAAGIPVACDCPGNRQVFLNAVQAALTAKVDGKACPNSFGIPVEFNSTDNSVVGRRKRIETAITVLQNIKGGFGKGCPAIATTFPQQLKATEPKAAAPLAG